MQSGNNSTAPNPNFGGYTVTDRIRELLKGSSKAFLLRVFGAAAAIGVQILVARSLGEKAFGDFSFALSIVGVLALAARIGLGTALLRFIGQYLARGDMGLISGLVFSAFLTVATVSGAFVLSGTWAIKVWGSDWPLGQVEALIAAAWLLPPLALMGIAQAILIGFKRIGPAIFAVQILRPGLFAIILAFAIGIMGRSPVAGTALHADAIAVSLTVTALIFLVASTTRNRANWSAPRFDTREWVAVSLPLMLMTGLQVLFNQTDIIMLGALTTSEETGVYAAAARIARLVLFGLTAINSVVAPMVAESYHSGRIKEMIGVLNFTSKILLGFTFSIVLILVLAGKEILGLFGTGFSAAWGPMLVLVSGQAINSLSGPVAYLLTMTGHQNTAARIVTVCAVLNILLNALLIPAWGIWGAATATAISVATWNLWMLISAKRLLGLNPSIFRKWRK